MITTSTTAPTEVPYAAAPRSTTARRGPRLVLRLVVVAILTLAGVGVVSGTAGASLLSATGTAGPSDTVAATCANRAYANQLRVEVPPPYIFAVDYRAGYGNDSQYVRYAVYLMNVQNGTVAYTSGYSGVAVAGDNVPARFSGSSVIAAAPGGVHQVQVRVEWLNNARTQVLGSAMHVVDQYRYYDVYNAYQGSFQTCKKF